MQNKISSDLEILAVRIENGEIREDILAEMTADEQFTEWYTNFTSAIELLLEE